jgi:ParB/RepB/Spo0J family partition protein
VNIKKLTKLPEATNVLATFFASELRRDDKAIMLSVSSIKVKSNVRGDLGDLQELTESIRINGIWSPLLVQQEGDQYLLVAGHRRLAVAKALSLEAVPARLVVGSLSVISLLDNLQRQNLSGWDTCRAIHGLLPLFEDNQSRLAEAIQKSKSYVSQAVAVVNSNLEVQHVKHLSLREIFQLASIKNRKSPGPVPGGRFVTGAIRYRDTKSGFTLQINWDSERTPVESKDKIIAKLEGILKKLKGQ